MRIDLHTHSNVSDGSDPPAAVMRRAAEAGLDVVALTDHDTTAGHEEARQAAPPSLTVVPGMELSCWLSGHSLHLLAYWADPGHAELASECRAMRDDRVRRARAMVERLQALGAPVTWDQVERAAAGGVVGRPHVAAAMAEAGVVAGPEEAFTPEWIGAGGRAHVGKRALDPVRAIRLVRAAGGVCVLAHPGAAARGWTIPDESVAGLAEAGLAGLEVDHPDHGPAQRRRLGALAARLGLVASGGSDDHGERTGRRIGCATIAPDAYERLRSQAAGLR